MIELETGVKVTEKTIMLSDLLNYKFNTLQINSFENRTNGETKKDLKYIERVGNQSILDLFNVILHKNNANEYTVINKDEEVYALAKFMTGVYSFKDLYNGKRYYFHNIEDTTLINNFKIHLTIVEGAPIDSFEKTMYNSSLRKSPEELLELLFIGPWVEDMQRYFKGRSSPAKRVFSQYTDKKIPNLDLMNVFVSYMARINNQTKESYIQSVYKKKNAKEEWEYYRENIVDMLNLYGWNN